MKSSCSRWLLSSLFAFLVLARAAFGAAPQPNPLDPVVELPTVTVTDSQILPPPESWRYATIPGFEILTNASERETQKLMRDFQMFTMAFDLVWPLPPRQGPPISIILSGWGGKFQAFRPANEYDPTKGTASLFLTDRERSAIVVDLQATTLQILPTEQYDPAAGVDGSTVSVDHYRQLYREFIRYRLSQSNPRMPAWLEEGIAQIAMAMQFTPRSVEFAQLRGGAVPPSASGLPPAEDSEDDVVAPGEPVEDEDFHVVLRRRRLIPFGQFFAVTHDSPEARNPLGNNVWAKQAYGFVHMCLYGEGKRYQKPFGLLIARASREPITEALFQECFGMTYKQMATKFRLYADSPAYEAKVYSAKGKTAGFPVPVALDLREATPVEVGRIKGEALELAGHMDRARLEFLAPYVRGSRDPELLAVLGLHEKKTGQDERARRFLEGAVAGKTVRPQAYLELARMRLAEAGPQAELSAEQTAAVMAPLKAGVSVTPLLPEIVRMMPTVWARSAEMPSREDVAMFQRGVLQFPRDLRLAYHAAFFSAQAGMTKEARIFVEHGLKYATDPKQRAAFEEVQRLLPASATEAPATR